MFFRLIAFLAILLVCGCAGRTLHEDPHNEVVPPGTAEVLERVFDPSLNELIHSLTYSTFDDPDCGYSGYYFPGLGVSISEMLIGRVEFETSLTHEVLHAVHFHGLIDKDKFARILDRLRADPEHSNFVKEATAEGWRGFVYFLFTESEYFARVGDEIVRRRGINVPAYLWEVYEGILHPRIRQHGETYTHNPFPMQAEVRLSDKTKSQRNLIAHGLGLFSVHERILPRRDVEQFSVDLDMAVPPELRSATTLSVIFRRRASGEVITSCAATFVVNKSGERLRCYWDAQQARSILQAWLDFDLLMDVTDPMLALHRR